MNRFLLSLSFLSCLTFVFPQKITFEFDYAQFGYDSLSNYVEFYYSFNQLGLTYVDTDTLDYVQGLLQIQIDDSITSANIIDKHWIISNEIKDSAGLDRSLIGMVGFVIDKGSYIVNVTGSDVNNPLNKKTINENIYVIPFHNSTTSLSDVQLASNIVPNSDNTSSIFYKNTYEVTPLPASVGGEMQPVMFYYTELYNLKADPTNSEMRLDEMIINSRGQLISSKSKRINKSADTRVEVGIVKAYKLPTDTYTLMLNLIDSVANYGVSSSKRFFVYNPSVVPADTFQTTISPVLSTTFGAMSEEEIDDLFDKSKYIATAPETDRYKALSTEEAKREFIYTFWKARDENPSDDRNENYLNYVKRVNESDARFSALGKKGWKTDRGRVLIIYGEPTEIQRYPNTTDARPYEIWRYESLEGGVEFIFGDLTGFSDYQLLHSTKRGELRDDYWQRRIAIN
ncbi:MAG: GWxTD domain-containing protein [Ignavibacteriaceae bacterium]|jgi:GWxTD domain-containing protein|nr:GWxTD domain-containing protein [Ignavibacteriaceae bacterium]